MAEPAHDALDALRARLEETRAHAERLAQEAADIRRMADEQAATREPAGGGESASGPESEPALEPDAEPGPSGPLPLDLQSIAALLETLRELVPPELQQQLAEVTRQILLLLRALIDWWVDRLEEPAPSPAGTTGDGPPAQDIPVR